MGKEHENILLQNIDYKNPDTTTYNQFIASWQALVDDYQLSDEETAASDSSKIVLAKFEGVANKVLLDLAARDDEANATDRLDGEFSSLPGSMLLVSARGMILDANDKASISLDVGRGDPINRLGFVLDNDKKLRNVIARIAGASSDDDRVVLIRGTRRGESRHDTMAVVQSVSQTGAQPHALVILLDAPWNPMASELIAGNFKLTQTEVDIIESFIVGHSPKEIAKQRQRSYTTIRNQFQSILDKTGSKNQTELLNLLLSVGAMLATVTAPPKSKINRYHRQIEIMRPHGRFVDVLLYGDLKGKPVISLPSIFGHATTPEIDETLHKAGLMMIGIAPPGFGRTSFEPAGKDPYEVLAGDIRAVLDNLEIEKCIFVGRASAACAMFRLGAIIPQRMERALIINPMVPRSFIPDKSIISKWAASLMSASKVSPTIATLIISSGNQLMQRIGAKRFISRMYDHSPADQLAVEDPSVAKCVKEGSIFSTAQGTKAAARDMINGFKDWSKDVENCQLPVTLIDGTTNPQIPIEACRAFVAAYPGHLNLIELPDGGGLMNFTHLDQIIRILKTPT